MGRPPQAGCGSTGPDDGFVEGFFVELESFFDHEVGGEIFRDADSPGLTQGLGKSAIFQDALHSGTNLRHIGAGNNQTTLAINDDLRQSAAVKGDGRDFVRPWRP